MDGRECFHCKQWIEAGQAHDCWTTTEGALTRDLPEDIREAWERLRETATEFGDQRIYASHSSIMFSRKACYFFVRPKSTRLEVCFFLGRTLKVPQVRTSVATSRVKVAHTVHVRHRDEVEPPLTDWLREAYQVSPALSGRAAKTRAAKVPAAQTTAKQTAPTRQRRPAPASKSKPTPAVLKKRARKRKG